MLGIALTQNVKMLNVTCKAASKLLRSKSVELLKHAKMCLPNISKYF